MVLYLPKIWLRSSMDRMTDSGSVGWGFESLRSHTKVEKAFSIEFGEAFVIRGV